MKKLIDILKDIFPFLRNAMEKFWDTLPDKTKEALIDAGHFGQILKMKYAEGYEAFVTAISDKLGMDRTATDAMLMNLAGKLGIDIKSPEQLFDALQDKVNAILDDSAWDNLWHSVTGQLQIIFTGGRMNWAQLAMGVIQFVYDKFIKKD